MKIRNGFVSNSSSSSFIVNKINLSYTDTQNIYNHIEYAKKLAIENELYDDFKYAHQEDAWTIYDKHDTLELYTHMDNFDMGSFLEAIGLKRDVDFKYSDY